MSGTTALLDIRGIGKRYGPTVALEHVDLSVGEGEFVVLLGPSGSGKTTLLSILGGFIEPSHGEIWLGGQDITAVPPARRPTTTVFQDYALFPHMSIARNVGFGLAMRGVAGRERRHRVEQCLELVGLAGYGKRRIQQLSGGQRQRVALARALAVEPTLLLLDEPLGALDLKLRQQMQDELRQLQHRTGTTFIHVTHDQDEAMQLADTVVVMNQGRIEDQGPPEQVYLRPASRFSATFMGDSNLVPASVAAVSNGTITLTAALFDNITLHCDQALALNADITLAIRPEHVHIIDDQTPNDDTAVALGQAHIIERVFAGSALRVTARSVNDSERVWKLLLAQSTRLKIAPGERISLGVRRDDIVLLQR